MVWPFTQPDSCFPSCGKLPRAWSADRHFAHNHPGLYPLTIRAPEPDEEALISLSQELLQMLLLLMASLGQQGDEALHAIRGLRAILHGFVSLDTAGGFKMALDQEESFRRLLEAYLALLPGK
jgi:hypothetical protein